MAEEAGSSASDPKTRAFELKAEGNQLFAKKEYDAAVAVYDEALELDPANHVLLGNKAACLSALERFEDALRAADLAIKADPTWSKGYFRRAQALSGLDRFEEARDAMRDGAQHSEERQTRFFQRQVQLLSMKIHELDWERPVVSPDHWIRVFDDIPNVALRLGSMVFFWNKSTREERLAILQRALALLGPSVLGVDPATFTEDRMDDLPLKNYARMKIPDPWLAFYESLPSDDKVSTFDRMWNAASPQEKTLIVEDLKFFFLSPPREAEEDAQDGDCGAAASGAAPEE